MSINVKLIGHEQLIVNLKKSLAFNKKTRISFFGGEKLFLSTLYCNGSCVGTNAITHYRKILL